MKEVKVFDGVGKVEVPEQFNYTGIWKAVVKRVLEDHNINVPESGKALLEWAVEMNRRKTLNSTTFNFDDKTKVDKDGYLEGAYYKATAYLESLTGGRSDSYGNMILDLLGIASIKDIKLGMTVDVKSAMGKVDHDYPRLGKLLSTKLYTDKDETIGYELEKVDVNSYKVVTYNKKVVRK